ncbi:MAG: D-alanyl-D-alanine carboxypeptidase/D-alanyl-D-alanine-endopeptidase [Candidatus Schekmanbacteria bacterium]|nr:D-alanyl-D-alanine carboxypeptidase/D-alanyl-D-alanine-endopeptidase [Candidatus Schekmanbacteria bacterium]
MQKRIRIIALSLGIIISVIPIQAAPKSKSKRAKTKTGNQAKAEDTQITTVNTAAKADEAQTKTEEVQPKAEETLSLADIEKLKKLSGQMARLVQAAPLRKAKMGIDIVSIKDGRQIFSHNADLPLIPASNMKILTSLAALSYLGSEYRFKTEIYGEHNLSSGVINGNLYIKGYGDPILVWEEMIKIARYLHGTGLRQVKGDLIADESYFDNERNGKAWKKSTNGNMYSAPLGALSANFNIVEVNVSPGDKVNTPLNLWTNPPTTFFHIVNKAVTAKGRGTLYLNYQRRDDKPTLILQGHMPPGRIAHTFYRAIDDPPVYAASAFRELLSLWGIKIEGQIKVDVTPNTAKLIYTHESRPLSLILRGLNKYSNNFTAEQLIKTVGATVKGEPGTAEKGLEALRERLKALGVDDGNLVLADGSGLSTENRVTPKTLTKVLCALYNDFNSQPEFMASLAITGKDGTLRRRMKTTQCVRAKTGHINGVAALSGYVFTKDKEIWAFSMLMNDGGGYAQTLQDKLCNLMVNFSCGEI